MPILFSDLIQDEAFNIKNRKQLRTFYEVVKREVAAKTLKLEGHTLPTTFNAWLSLVEPSKKLSARDADVVDFSLKDDKAYATWRKAYLSEQNPVYLSAGQKELLERVQNLEAVSQASMALMNGAKDDVVAALSDLQAAVYMFGASYDKVYKSLGLPERRTSLERVKTGKPKTNKPKKTAAKQTPNKTPEQINVAKPSPKKRRKAATSQSLSAS